MIEPPDVSWNVMFKEVETLSGRTQHRRELIKEGWKKLANALGNDWPARAQEQGHPWIGEWYNKAPWVKALYGHIGHQIDALRSKNHFDAIIERLKDPKTTYPARAEINAAWKLSRVKIPFEFIKPSQRNKSYDIQAQIDRKEVGIEVSTLNRSPKFKKQMAIFQRIGMSLNGLGSTNLDAAGQIHRMLSQTHADHLVKLIEQGKHKAQREDRAVRINEPAFQACIVPKRKTHQLEEWKQEMGIGEDISLTGPDFDSSTGRRLHAKILRKSKQIPDEIAGVVYVEGVPVYLDKEHLTLHHFTMADIEEAVYEKANLLFVVLNSRSMGWGFNQRVVGDNMYASKIVRYRLLSEETLVVVNRFTLFSRLRHKRVIKAFMS